MKIKKITLHDLFYNDKFLVFFSLIAAFAVWVTISMTAGTEIERTIENVKVNVDLQNSVPSQFNLRMFGQTEFTVSVTVKGKRYAVGALTADDISVTALTNNVNSMGKHPLPLRATPKDGNSNYEIVGKSMDYIEAFFDTYKEGTYQLETDIVAEKLIPDGYVTEEPLLSSNVVTMGGPASEINKITKVLARVSVPSPLTSTATIEASVIPFNNVSGTIPTQYLTVLNEQKVTVTVPVYKVKELPVSIDFINTPKAYVTNPPTYTVTPSVVKIAAEEAYIDKLEKISDGTLDFSNIGAASGTFVFKAADVKDVKFIDGTESFSVKISLGETASAIYRLKAGNISFSNVPAGYRFEIADSTDTKVDIVGSKSSIAGISSDNIFGIINLSGLTPQEGITEMPVSVVIKENPSCWAYGTYKIKVKVTKILQ